LSFPLAALLCALGGYLIGSISFGLLAGRMAGIDIRSIGSGNIGATNVLRTGRKDLALLTLVGDAGKGAVCVLLAWLAFRDRPDTAALMAIAGGAAFIGHCFSVWLKFKGGKGMATFLGVILATAFFAGLLACLTWLVVAFLFRYSSLAALMAAALTPLFVFLTNQPYPMLVLSIVLVPLVFLRHRENIRRLIMGEEPRIGAKKAA
jgi:glycerol-3-phosphate acyltransferase PlsY